MDQDNATPQPEIATKPGESKRERKLRNKLHHAHAEIDSYVHALEVEETENRELRAKITQLNAGIDFFGRVFVVGIGMWVTSRLTNYIVHGNKK